MHEKRQLTVQVDTREQHGGRTYGYSVSTVARLSGAHPETVRREIRANRLNMEDLLAVADWIRRRQVGHNFAAIGRRCRCSRKYVADAASRGEFRPDDFMSVELWVQERQHRTSHPTPGPALTRYTLFRSSVRLRHTGATVGSKKGPALSHRQVQHVIEELRSIGFTGAERRGPNHIYLKPDLVFVHDAKRLLNRMHRAGLSASQVDTQARRWLTLFAGLPARIRALGQRINAAGSRRSGAASSSAPRGSDAATEA